MMGGVKNARQNSYTKRPIFARKLRLPASQFFHSASDSILIAKNRLPSLAMEMDHSVFRIMDLSMYQFCCEMNINEPRVPYYKLAPEGIKHLRALEGYLANCGLEKSLLELVKLRASQINGCA